MEENKSYYWNGLEEFSKTPEYQHSLKDEFKEDLPMEEVLSEETFELKSNRRGFLKAFGFGITAATLAACTETPVRKAIPYVIKPDNVTPGVPDWYATTCGGCAAGCALLVKSREGRPIKIEGNRNSPLSQGGTCAVGQATVLNLYDFERLKTPQVDGADKSWEEFDTALVAAMKAAQGNTVVLSNTIHSPSTRAAIAGLADQHVMYDVASVYAMAKANQKAMGKKVIPTFKFEDADVIVSFGADFLGTWISPVEFTKGYAKKRKVSKDNPNMSKHYQFEALMSLTGSNADVRVPVKASSEGEALKKLYTEITGDGSVSGTVNADVDAKLKEAAQALKAARGKSLVISGSNDVAVQEMVNAINEALGNNGATIDFSKTSNQALGDDDAMWQLVQDMNAGKVSNLIIYHANPAYDYAEAEAFKAALSKVANVVAVATKKDETAKLAKYIASANHYLESWGDANPRQGVFGLTQPLIRPLFDTRQGEDSILAWTAGVNGGEASGFLDMVKENTQKLQGQSGTAGPFVAFWESSLKKGVIETGGAVSAPVNDNDEAADANDEPTDDQATTDQGADEGTNDQEVVAGVGGVAAIAAQLPKPGSDLELVLYQKVGIRDGRWANNPWLQELPDPVTKVVWDQCVLVSYNDAKGKMKDEDLVDITVGGKTITAPVVIVPGQADGTIGLAIGYGRSDAGVTANGIGRNVAGLAQGKGVVNFVLTGAQIANKNQTYPLAKTQYYMGYEMSERGEGGFDALSRQATEERIDNYILKDTTLEEYKTNRKAGNENRDFIKHHNETYSLWDEHTKEGHWWAMSIDLNSCTGCGACIVSCNAENNVFTVGKEEVATRREMHWMRIDRYFKGHPGDQSGNLQVAHQPMLCQHCDNAPCETVCPVLATVHSDEGLNQQVYNRCIGTRYCANNCPYKVRRFNWFSYYSNEKFNDPAKNAPNAHYFNDYGRMVLNPDVTVRARGVMEKCSFCVQRIQSAKLEAKADRRKLEDGEIITACQQSCPADAIVFGDLNDEKSAVRKQYFGNERIFHALEEVKTLPSVSYMTKVRNCEPDQPAAKSAHSEEEHA